MWRIQGSIHRRIGNSVANSGYIASQGRFPSQVLLASSCATGHVEGHWQRNWSFGWRWYPWEGGLQWMGCTDCSCTKEGWQFPHIWWLQGYHKYSLGSWPASFATSRGNFCILVWGSEILYSSHYQQIVLDESSCKLVTISTHKGVFQYIPRYHGNRAKIYIVNKASWDITGAKRPHILTGDLKFGYILPKYGRCKRQ